MVYSEMNTLACKVKLSETIVDNFGKLVFDSAMDRTEAVSYGHRGWRNY